MKRFANREEMKPLLWLCYAGKLFDVQKWIADGKPLNPPLPEPKKRRWPGPLEEAIDMGFHSLVQVLLEGGANLIEPHNYEYGEFCAITDAVRAKRMDLIKLLVEHGADPKKADMRDVFDTWDPEIMRYFIDRGADVTTNNPLAYAFELKIRTTLGIYKKYEKQFPDWQRQINIALRHHANQKNRKWVSLLLWAGADPYEVGAQDSWEDEDYGESALEVALYYNLDWMLKQIKKLTPPTENARALMSAAWRGENPKNIVRLIEAGFLEVMPQTDKSELVAEIMQSAAYSRHDRDSSLVTLDLILRDGARWEPTPEQIKETRRWMVKGRPFGFQSVVKLLKTHKAAESSAIQELIRTSAAQRQMYS